ncbi:hypothetical protein PVAP13_3KG235927, partial [Panicum virgatum]
FSDLCVYLLQLVAGDWGLGHRCKAPSRVAASVRRRPQLSSVDRQAEVCTWTVYAEKCSCTSRFPQHQQRR